MLPSTHPGPVNTNTPWLAWGLVHFFSLLNHSSLIIALSVLLFLPSPNFTLLLCLSLLTAGDARLPFTYIQASKGFWALQLTVALKGRQKPWQYRILQSAKDRRWSLCPDFIPCSLPWRPSVLPSAPWQQQGQLAACKQPQCR